MKKLFFSIAAVALLSTSSYAGKNVQEAVLPPVPVPKAPQKPIEPSDLPPLGLYIGGGLTYAHSSCKCPDIGINTERKGNTYGVNLMAGYDIFDYAAIEAKYFYTPWGDKDKTIKHYGIYLKPKYALSDNFEAYALLGYGKTECEYQSQDEKGFSWCIGGEYTFEANKGQKSGLGIYAEYMQPVRKTGSKEVKVHTGNVGIAYHF